MKLPALLLVLFSLSVGLSSANPFAHIATTDRDTLNDLLDDFPLYSLNREEELKRLSAIQEQLIIFEEEMRGKGLPEPLESAFSIHYSAIMDALVDDRIPEEVGRDALYIHRQLLTRTRAWTRQRIRDEKFPEQVIQNLHYFLTELEPRTVPEELVPIEIRTPVINGYQFWVGELLAWGETCCHLNPGEVGRLRIQLGNLERFEALYKRDGILYPNEREDLHRRFLKLTRYTIEILSRR